ncbi:MAG: succinate dehydrogenase cytochrome b subunit [Elusimicrobia bacterium]|nr:succinate dehydrogenase cytochrome b subunit [Elusimicrobiota bacterium]
METLSRIVTSSIGRKMMVAALGLLLCGFLGGHLAGNLLLFVGPGAFNAYAHHLETFPLLLPVELGLASIILLHAAVTVYLWFTALGARPVGYAVSVSKGGRTWGSSTMIYTAVLILVFIAVHVLTFKYGTRPSPEDLYGLVMGYLGDWRWAVFYSLVMGCIGLHLSHGFWSACQTFGLDHPKYAPAIKAAGTAFAVAVALAFASIPVWACFIKGGRP